MSVFVVLNPTTCLAKLNFIFHFREIGFGLGHEHNAQLENEGERGGAAATLHNSKRQKTARKCNYASVPPKILRDLRKLGSAWTQR